MAFGAGSSPRQSLGEIGGSRWKRLYAKWGKWYQTALALNPVGHGITAVGRLEFEAEAGNAKEKSVFLPPFALGQLGGASAPQPPSERSSTFGGGFRLFSARRPPQRPIIGWLHA